MLDRLGIGGYTLQNVQMQPQESLKNAEPK
jgi:hypothetical protein